MNGKPVKSFKPLARIISSVTMARITKPTTSPTFQTACANYFLCDRLDIAAKALIGLVSNRLRELFPL